MSKNSIIWIIAALLVILGAIYIIRTPAGPGRYDTFASCINDSGAKFYGAFWCPHCQNQKAMFGSSARLLPYIECSTPDGRNQLPLCTEAGVSGYPTWEFVSGTTTLRESGELSFERLSELTSCPLPENVQ